MNPHSEYNLRQYRQIAFALRDFDQDKISLDELSVKLEALINSLTEIDRGLREQFLGEWDHPYVQENYPSCSHLRSA